MGWGFRVSGGSELVLGSHIHGGCLGFSVRVPWLPELRWKQVRHDVTSRICPNGSTQSRQVEGNPKP